MFSNQSKICLALTCLVMISLAASNAHAQVNPLDSLTLRTLFLDTKGGQWHVNSNWLSARPLQEWFGVEVTAGRVTALHLANNNLQGAIPSELGKLEDLLVLELQDNDLEDLPDLQPLTQLTRLRIENNRLGFEDIEPNIDLADGIDFRYAPQEGIPSLADSWPCIGEELSYEIEAGGDNNLYQFFRNDKALTEISEDNSYRHTVLSTDDVGHYTCHITNSIATQLTIIHEIHSVLDVTPLSPKPSIERRGDSLYCTVSADSYSWRRDGAALPGGDRPVIPLLASGVYSVTVRINEFCPNSSANFDVVVGVDDKTGADWAIHIWPNPVSDRLNVQGGNDAARELNLEVVDTFGRSLQRYSYRAEGEQHIESLDLSSLPAGTYFLRVDAAGFKTLHTLIKR